jgi:hypothetical protein
MGASLCLLAACVTPVERAAPTSAAAITFVAPTAVVPAPSPSQPPALSLRLTIAASATMLAQISGLSTAEAREAAGVVLDQQQTLARAGELNLAGVHTLLELIGESTPDQKPSERPERYVDESYLGRARP